MKRNQLNKNLKNLLPLLLLLKQKIKKPPRLKKSKRRKPLKSFLLLLMIRKAKNLRKKLSLRKKPSPKKRRKLKKKRKNRRKNKRKRKKKPLLPLLAKMIRKILDTLVFLLDLFYSSLWVSSSSLLVSTDTVWENTRSLLSVLPLSALTSYSLDPKMIF